jgi:hypothetical protein
MSRAKDLVRDNFPVSSAEAPGWQGAFGAVYTDVMAGGEKSQTLRLHGKVQDLIGGQGLSSQVQASQADRPTYRRARTLAPARLSFPPSPALGSTLPSTPTAISGPEAALAPTTAVSPLPPAARPVGTPPCRCGPRRPASGVPEAFPRHDT